MLLIKDILQQSKINDYSKITELCPSYLITRMRLSRGHTSANAQQSPLFQSSLNLNFKNKTHLNLLDLDFYFDVASDCTHSYIPATTICQIIFIKIQVCEKKVGEYSCIVPLSGSTPEDNVDYSGKGPSCIYVF